MLRRVAAGPQKKEKRNGARYDFDRKQKTTRPRTHPIFCLTLSQPPYRALFRLIPFTVVVVVVVVVLICFDFCLFVCFCCNSKRGPQVVFSCFMSLCYLLI
uniref:Uncharacterized protein n=1 Tax=Trypanosoma vivax (strain Y486) TaxID=1055687 RepID=G0UAB5_TRYVY|nr:hypothetical protein, unlikely [Trypanosoma vivax Y486]